MEPFRIYSLITYFSAVLFCSAFSGDSCQKSCKLPNGCTPAPDTISEEEVIIVTNGKGEIADWGWETIDMVVSSNYIGTPSTVQTACIAHSKGKRFGLRYPVPANVTMLLTTDLSALVREFGNPVQSTVNELVADRIVYDLLNFFAEVSSMERNKTYVLSIMSQFLMQTTNRLATTDKIHSQVHCIIPWEPPCADDCSDVKTVLNNCHILMMSPDSYMPVPDAGGNCIAGPAIPITKFLYGIDRYIDLRPMRGIGPTIVAGIAWHGYQYTCTELKDNICTVKSVDAKRCYDETNRIQLSLSAIHGRNIEAFKVNMDVINKGVFYNDEQNKKQLWFDNFTTLAVKYSLVKDLELRGMSLWYGEDLMMSVTNRDSQKFTLLSWDFLTHNILHKATYSPKSISHYYADTVAGVAVGCLLLGVALGVTFACIGFKRGNCSKYNRPFKLDGDEDFRDDEGL